MQLKKHICVNYFKEVIYSRNWDLRCSWYYNESKERVSQAIFHNTNDLFYCGCARVTLSYDYHTISQHNSHPTRTLWSWITYWEENLLFDFFIPNTYQPSTMRNCLSDRFYAITLAMTYWNSVLSNCSSDQHLNHYLFILSMLFSF